MSLTRHEVETIVTKAFNSNIDDILRTLFGSVTDENDDSYTEVYKHELGGILEDLISSLYHLHVCLAAEDNLTSKTVATIILLTFGGVMVTEENNTDLNGLYRVSAPIAQALAK